MPLIAPQEVVSAPSRVIENDYLFIEVKDGVIFSKFKCKTEITLEVAKEMVKMRSMLLEGKNAPMIMDMKNIKSSTREAREYFKEDESIRGVLCGSFIVPTPFHQMMLNFFLKITAPVVPSKSFSDPAKATEWAQGFLP